MNFFPENVASDVSVLVEASFHHLRRRRLRRRRVGDDVRRQSVGLRRERRPELDSGREASQLQ